MEFTTMLGMLGEGFLVTLQLFFVTLVGALPLGVLVALGRMSRFRPISYLFRLYISLMRGTPLMLQLMFIFFAPYYIFGVQLSMDWKFGACAVAFIMNYSAYFAEIYRSGIQSIPRGQYEAAEILGYSKACSSRIRRWRSRSAWQRCSPRRAPSFRRKARSRLSWWRRYSIGCSPSWSSSPFRASKSAWPTITIKRKGDMV